jgi:voltage-gated potassium channel
MISKERIEKMALNKSDESNAAEISADSGLASPAAAAADKLAKPMFCLSLLFLFLLAGLVVAWVDVLPDPVADEMSTAAIGTSDPIFEDFWKHPALQTGYVLFGLMLLIWPLFLIEPIYVRSLAKGAKSKYGLDWFCVLCPPLRLGKSIPAKDGEIWLPRLGWHPPGKPLHKGLERIFSKPMLIIAMLILPVLLIEFRYQELLQSTMWLKLLLSISMGLIWCAFTIEFILMVSSTNKKLAYVKKNWIDLAIILLPLISFLRSLRIVRAAKLARFAKLQQLTKMGRVYRMRGLLAKTIRAFLVLELVHRILKTSPEKRLNKLLAQVEEKEDELRELQQQVASVRAEIEDQELEAELFASESEAHAIQNPVLKASNSAE